MPDKLIITDVDDCILQCSPILQNYYAERTGLKPVARLWDVHYLHKSFGTEEMDIVEDFWNSNLFSRLPPDPCAVNVIPMLKGKNYDFAAISNCQDTPRIREHRQKNLNMCFPNIFYPLDLHLTYGSSKANALGLYDPENAVFVEDNLSNAIIAADLGFTTFLLDRPHNSTNVNSKVQILRVSCWHDIYKILEKEK